MKRFTFLLAAVLVPLCAMAKNDDNSGWHFPVGLTYASGAKDVTDAVLGDLTASTSTQIPVGLSFSPYRQFSNGLGVGVDVGPFVLVHVEVTRMGSYSGSSTSTSSGVLMPVGLYGRYDFVRDGDVSPYVRGGIRKLFVGGDDVFQEGSAGLYGNVGVEFSHKRAVRFGFEAGFDTTTVKILGFNSRDSYHQTKVTEVKPYSFTFSIYASF